ncbi:MAG: D-alanine--D-alanine ligase [Anaerolineae bacterium]|nr:D-alanine--D-alanine ligase [Anaerolineae bacterium]NIN99166.1 D-alanine--D-alanine ligase [Anaerolineae bacterium]NIQ82007.1 D-alanine--D-alanine ligase [Anaerolineae bacterium]
MADKSASKKLRVGVVLGGISSEREISLESGRNIYFNLNPQKYEGVPIFLDGEGKFWEIPLQLLVQNTTVDITDRLEEEATRIAYEELASVADFVYIGLHGKYGEDGCLQGLLELLGIPYTGSGVMASAIGMDKHLQRKLLAAAGIKVPKYLPVTEREWAENEEEILGRVEDSLGYPCVVKPTREGCSTGLGVVREPGQMGAALENAFQWDTTALLEELLVGTEITCGVIGNRELTALPPTETIRKGEYLTVEEKFLPGEGENITPARLPEDLLKKIQEVMLQAYRALGLKVYARMDGFVVDGEVIVTEPNTLPGMTPSTCIFHEAAEVGIGPMEFVDRIIELSLEAHARKKGPLA